MSIIAMAVYCTEENKKDECLHRTLQSIYETTDTIKHKLVLSVNSRTEKTMELLREYIFCISEVIFNDTNLGTAEAINKAFKLRKPGENCIKMDDDVVIHEENWVEQMEEAIRRDPSIGIIGLKRKDCIENVSHPDEYYRSTLLQLPHNAGEKWILAEEVHHVMGTCQMYSSALLDKIGYLWQPKLYGWDDVLASARSRAAGFKNVFLPHIDIDHIDDGQTPFQGWKERHAWEDVEMVNNLMEGYKNGTQSIYYNPFE